MSETASLAQRSPASPTAPAGLPWRRWVTQAGAVMRLDLRKGFRRPWGLVLLALAPVAIALIRVLFSADAVQDRTNAAEATEFYAWMYQTLILRLELFLAGVAVFGNLIRREILDRTLHYYFLSPIRREVLLAAKYLTGVLVTFTLFGLSTVISFALAYAPHEWTAVSKFLFQGAGLQQLGSYLLVTFLACVGYGAVFLALGFFFKSPAVPALAMFAWESIHFLLPPLLKQASVIHYLQSLCPVPIPEGPLAVLSDAPAPWVSVLGLLVLAVVLVTVSGWRIRGMEISYDES
ncbi:MAG: type transport system permease protein [Acidobacteriota bacterium]|jgi:ABC-type transport system involved in multi-copper enzyme maturation permease subunit|nr:type transport system permease protein [Acidobacteriota bacterium]